MCVVVYLFYSTQYVKIHMFFVINVIVRILEVDLCVLEDLLEVNDSIKVFELRIRFKI